MLYRKRTGPFPCLTLLPIIDRGLFLTGEMKPRKSVYNIGDVVSLLKTIFVRHFELA